MSKRRTTCKRLLAALLALTLALALAVPVLAEEVTPPSITIVPNDNTDVTPGRFVAYEIFVGKLADDFAGDSTSGNGWSYTAPNSNKLTVTGWGNGVNVEAFVGALIADQGGAFGGAFAGMGDTYAATAGEGKQAYGDLACALEVAGILSDKASSPAFVKAFAALAATHKTSNAKTSTYHTATKRWVIGGDASFNNGYYLIVDTRGDKVDGDNTTQGESTSEYMLTVAGNTTMYVKSDAPEVEKTIVTDAARNTTATGATFDIGDTVTFRLTGTLPENYASYKEYQYTFHDTLSKGLSYTANSIKVYAVDDENTRYVIASDAANPQVTVGTYSDATGTDLTVRFSDLKTVTGAKVGETTTTVPGTALDSDWEIVVEYNAVLNTAADLGNTGNPNTVYLQYSNDPTDGGVGTNTTTVKTAYAFTFGLDLLKTGVGTDSAALAGAGFTLTNSEGAYATFTRGDGNYTLDGWVAQEQLRDDHVYILSSDTDGKMIVRGLDVGEYTLTEVVTPTSTSPCRR